MHFFKPIHAAFIVAICIASSMASAETVRMMDADGHKLLPSIRGEINTFEADIDFGEAMRTIELDFMPRKAQIRHVYQVALRNNKEWSDVPGAAWSSDWAQVPNVKSWIELFSGTPSVSLEWKREWTQAVDASLGDDWSEIARQCAVKGSASADQRNCYVYEARREFRLWAPDERYPVSLFLHLAGGP